MSTRANIVINGEQFHVECDGGEKDDIVDVIEEYVRLWKHRVVDMYLPGAVINALCAECLSGRFGWFVPGRLDDMSADFEWQVLIGIDGTIEIEKVKGA